MTSNSEEIKTGSIPVNIALLISVYLEIADMENWAEAVSMQEQFRRKILKAMEMQKSLDGLEYLNAKMIETLAATDFRLTFRTMQRLSKQAESFSQLDADDLDESEDTSIPEVFFEFTVLDEHGAFLELCYTSEGHFYGDYRRHISDLARPLTREMAKNFAKGDRFVLYSLQTNIVSSEVHATLLKHLMAAIRTEKFLFVNCPIDYPESPLETLLRHCRHYQLQATAAGQMYPNLEFHVVR